MDPNITFASTQSATLSADRVNDVEHYLIFVIAVEHGSILRATSMGRWPVVMTMTAVQVHFMSADAHSRSLQ